MGGLEVPYTLWAFIYLSLIFMISQVLSGKEWLAAVPIAETVLVNLGDLMQFWTSDRYVATVKKNN